MSGTRDRGFNSSSGTVRFSISQELRQEQRQVLTQRMIQSMEILQLTLQQLEQRIEQELEQNPVLEMDFDEGSSDVDENNTDDLNTDDHSTDDHSTDDHSTDDHSADDHSADDHSAEDHSAEENGIADENSANENSADDGSEEESPFAAEQEPEIRLDPLTEHTLSREEFAIADDFAQNYSDTIDEAPIRSQNWLEDQEERRTDAFANLELPSETLQMHLIRQLDWFELSDPLRDMCFRIVNNLNASGYFPYTLEDFLGDEHTAEELRLAGEALTVVQGFDPKGVAGSNLRDCLLLQINPESPYAEVQKILITSCLEDISANRIPVIAKRIGISLDTVQEAVAELRHFNPRPSSGFGGETAPFVLPDVFVEKDEAGKYVVRLEEGRTPQLRVSSLYRGLLSKQDTDKETKAYIRKKVGSAQWLLDAIEQRRTTLLKVSQAIVDHQIDFFEWGQQSLKPLKMQQIADVIGMHVTTVSRACDDKWLASPRGVFPLRRFFVTGLGGADGGHVANDVVRLKIQEIVEKENKKEPLSDDAIVKMLESEGMQVARRTIVKYRQLLNIPSSHGRRQWDA